MAASIPDLIDTLALALGTDFEVVLATEGERAIAEVTGPGVGVVGECALLSSPRRSLRRALELAVQDLTTHPSSPRTDLPF